MTTVERCFLETVRSNLKDIVKDKLGAPYIGEVSENAMAIEAEEFAKFLTDLYKKQRV